MRKALWLVACVILACAAGCTSTASSTPSRTKPPRSSPSPDAVTHTSIELGCADAGSGTAPDGAGDVTAGGLILEGLAAQMSDVPLATDVGLVVAPGSSQHFRKSPAYLNPRTTPITIELMTPRPGQALAWVPAHQWTSGAPPNLQRWTTERVTFTGCADRDVTYFGGLLANNANACLHLKITQSGKAPESKHLRLDGKRC